MARHRVSGSREDELREVGLETYHAPLPEDPFESMIGAVAAMLAKADVQRRRKVEKPDTGERLPFSPHEFYTQLRARAGHLVITEPVENRLFGYLGGRLKSITGLERDDMDRVIGWIEAGGTRKWTVMPTFKHVVTNFDKFVAYAREWDRRGRQELNGGARNVGADTPESDPGSDFR